LCHHDKILIDVQLRLRLIIDTIAIIENMGKRTRKLKFLINPMERFLEKDPNDFDCHDCGRSGCS